MMSYGYGYGYMDVSEERCLDCKPHWGEYARQSKITFPPCRQWMYVIDKRSMRLQYFHQMTKEPSDRYTDTHTNVPLMFLLLCVRRIVISCSSCLFESWPSASSFLLQVHVCGCLCTCLRWKSCNLVLLFSVWGSSFFNHTHAGVCVLVWDSFYHLVKVLQSHPPSFFESLPKHDSSAFTTFSPGVSS